MDSACLVTALSVLMCISGTLSQSASPDAQSGNNPNYVFLSVDALKDLQTKANQNANQDAARDQLTSFNDARTPDQQRNVFADASLKTNPALQQINPLQVPRYDNVATIPQNSNYNPNGVNLVQALNNGIPQQVNPGLNSGVYAINTNGQLVALNPVQPNYVSNPSNIGQINPNGLGNNGQPNLLVANNVQPNNYGANQANQNPVYAVVPLNNGNAQNQVANGANTYLVPLRQVPSNQILTLNSGK